MNALEINKSSYDHYLAKGKLMAVRCQDCDSLYLPPRPLCPNCFGSEFSWVELEGKGTLAAFTTIHIAPTAMLEAGYGRDKPYCTGIVELEEGPAISAQILGVEAGHPETIKIGIPLILALLERGQGEEKQTFLAFRPLED